MVRNRLFPFIPHLLFGIVACSQPVDAQLRSAATSVTLRATVHDSLMVQYISLPVTQQSGLGGNESFGQGLIIVRWQLRQGQDLYVRGGSGGFSGNEVQPKSDFVSIAELIRLGSVFYYLPLSAEPKAVSSMPADAGRHAVGFVGLLVSAPSLHERGFAIYRISLAAF